jgi:hypothetical protein
MLIEIIAAHNIWLPFCRNLQRQLILSLPATGTKPIMPDFAAEYTRYFSVFSIQCHSPDTDLLAQSQWDQTSC